MGIELYFRAFLEWIAYGFISAYPIAQFQYRRLITCKIYKRMSCQNGQHIKVIGKLPVHLVGTHFRAQVWWIDEEHHTMCVLILIEHLLVVFRHNGQSVQIVAT